jgi:hypothetical protein
MSDSNLLVTSDEDYDESETKNKKKLKVIAEDGLANPSKKIGI